MKIKVNTVGNGTKVVTDKVELQACYLNPSFEFDAKFGSVNATIAIDKKEYEGSDLEKVIDTCLQVSYDEAVKKNPKYKTQITKIEKVIPEVDDNGNETGRVLIKLKNKAKIEKDGQLIDRKLVVVDSKNNRIEDYENLTSGTIARVSFTILPYFTVASKTCGISCWMNSIQVIEPKFYEGNSDFDVVENGWTAGVSDEDASILESLNEL